MMVCSVSEKTVAFLVTNPMVGNGGPWGSLSSTMGYTNVSSGGGFAHNI